MNIYFYGTSEIGVCSYSLDVNVNCCLAFMKRSNEKILYCENNVYSFAYALSFPEQFPKQFPVAIRIQGTLVY